VGPFTYNFQYRSNILNMRLSTLSEDRLLSIDARRRAVLLDGERPSPDSWLERSWLRCIAAGHKPGDQALFQAASASLSDCVQEENQPLIAASQPVMAQLGKAIANTQYFAVLTDSNGIVLSASGAFDKTDRRVVQLTTTGIDLSESAIGTTAIGAALAEKRAVWLHRGEHFLDDNRIYSCAGMPIFGTKNECLGMLDLTGIEVPERRELVHLAARSAKDIQNALLSRAVRIGRAQKILQLQWLGCDFDNANDGLIAFDDQGNTSGFNSAALNWVPDLASQPVQPSEAIFSINTSQFFASLHGEKTATLALWSGIQVQARWLPESTQTTTGSSLRNVEAELISRAITATKGNVAVAAEKLGISRATLYRKLHKKGNT
jgi:sigma-54 dependent transcriptional regulator, acetoin dehydrogenase operon transcriptional activator AcoR